MANDTPAVPAPLPQFRLNPAQMVALKLIEVQQNQLVVAANVCADASIGEVDAGKLLIEAGRIIEAAKMEWLKATQRVVTLAAAPVIPDVAGIVERTKANGRNLG